MNRTRVPLQPEIVTLKISPELLAGTAWERQESSTEDGAAVLVALAGVVPADQGFQISISSVENILPVREVHLTQRDETNGVRPLPHIHNTDRQEGVGHMEPFHVFRRESYNALAVGAPVKISAGAVVALITSLFHYAAINGLFWFSIIAVFDWVIGIFPRVHTQKSTRSATTLSRFYQWCLAVLFLGALFAVKQFLLAEHPSGPTGLLVKYLPNWYVFTVILIYLGRMYGSLMRAFFGEKAPKVMSTFAKFAPRRLRNFLSDRDINL